MISTVHCKHLEDVFRNIWYIYVIGLVVLSSPNMSYNFMTAGVNLPPAPSSYKHSPNSVISIALHKT